MQLFFEDPTGTALTGNSLPAAQAVFKNFIVQNFFIDGVETINGQAVQFQIQGAIPEAPSIALLGIGLAGLGCLKRRQPLNANA